MTTCSAMMQQIVNLPQPVIAAVQGIATAAGCQLVASCDLAVASAAAKFATPGVDIGLFCSTPMVALSRNVPRKQAMEMLLTGEMVPAEKAAQIGLINRVVPPGEERKAALALAHQIASKSSYTVKIGKQAFYRQLELGLAEAYAYASEVMTENMMARDAEEGICAFIEKRDAHLGGPLMAITVARQGARMIRIAILAAALRLERAHARAGAGNHRGRTRRLPGRLRKILQGHLPGRRPHHSLPGEPLRQPRCRLQKGRGRQQEMTLDRRAGHAGLIASATLRRARARLSWTRSLAHRSSRAP